MSGKSSVRRMYEEKAAELGVSVEVAIAIAIAEEGARRNSSSVEVELRRAIGAVERDPVTTPGRSEALAAYQDALVWSRSRA